MDREGPTEQEREVTAYLEEMIAAGLAKTRATLGPAPEPYEPAAAPGQIQSPPLHRPRRYARASMHDGLAGLFRSTEALPSESLGAPGVTGEHGLTSEEQTVFFRRFVRQASCSVERAASGVAALDVRLAGGFGPGLHALSGQPGVGKTAFLESVAWEAVSSERPVLYYALKEGGRRVWERLIGTLSTIGGGPVLPLSALRARPLDPAWLETIGRLDRTLQSDVLAWLSLIETVSGHGSAMNAFIEDVRLRAYRAEERFGRIPLVLVDDLEHLLPDPETLPPMRLVARLNEALLHEGLPGLAVTALSDRSLHTLGSLPLQTMLKLVRVPARPHPGFERVDVELRPDPRTDRTETLSLLVDAQSGLFVDSPATRRRVPAAPPY